MTDKTLVSREPWWAEPPKSGQCDADLEWGYLEIYSDGSVVFKRERPCDDEIESRSSCRL